MQRFFHCAVFYRSTVYRSKITVAIIAVFIAMSFGSLAGTMLFAAEKTVAKKTVPAKKIKAAPDAAFQFPAAKHGKGELKYLNGVPVLLLAGTPQEIGTQTGKLIGQSIPTLLQYPKEFLKRNRMQAKWPLIVGASKLLLTRISKSHRQEMDAVVRSLGKATAADELAVANTMLELRRIGGCSTLIVDKERSTTGGPLFGRNFDFPPLGILHKYGLVTVVRPQGKHAFATVGFPGLLGTVSGMNDAGLAIATLDVYRCNDGSPMFSLAGTPMMFTYRRILEECTTVKEAEKILRSVKHTTWMNLSVCDKNSSAVFELTPKSVVRRDPVKHLLSCTNHFRTAKLCKGKTCRRFAALSKSDQHKKLNIAQLTKYLHDVNQKTWTIQTMIFEPATLRLHVSLKNPPTTAQKMRILNLAPLFKPKKK